MFVLDTNHVRELAYPSQVGARLRSRLLQAEREVATTVITVEEEFRGILARTHRARDDERILGYDKLLEWVNFFARWSVLSWDKEALAAFAVHRRGGVRIGTQDLRIA